MKKENYLSSLTRENGFYIARFYSYENHAFNKIRFLWCSKKDVIKQLRKKYNCSVSHDFY